MDLETPGAQAPHTHPPYPSIAETQLRRPNPALAMAGNSATQVLDIAQNHPRRVLAWTAGVNRRARNPWGPLPQRRLPIRGRATEHCQTNKVTNTGGWRQSFDNIMVF